MLVTSDIIGAYHNIPQDDGSDCLNEALEERTDKNIPSQFLVKLMDLIQKYNIFEFHDGQLWKQLIGVAMGIHPAPSFANIYLARRLDTLISRLAEKYGEQGKSSFLIFKRFLDDLFQIFKGTTKQLHSLYDEINEIHPTLKFTMTHTSVENERPEDRCTCEPISSIPFLDTLLSIENGRVIVDLYKKPSDRNQYLLPSSCHPETTTKAIPFSLSLRIVRICSKPNDRDKRLAELKELLLARNYPEDLINRSIEKARKIPRKVALLKVQKKTSESGSVFILKYDARLSAISQIVARHWRSMKAQDKYLSDCFNKSLLTAFRRQPNLKNLLIKKNKKNTTSKPLPQQGPKGYKEMW